jgi:succinoglycan biosynthesis protein ExoA
MNGARTAGAPFVSVLVPVLDEAAHVGVTVPAVLGGDYPSDRLEVLVIDGGSQDGTRDIVNRIVARDPRVRLLDNPDRTTSAGLNIGWRAARGEVIVRMDGHCRPAPDYVRACVAALDRTGAWCVGGHMVGLGETPFGTAVAAAQATRLGAGDAAYRLGGEGAVDTVYLGAWPRSVLERLSGFDPGLTRNQDYELATRIRAAGGTVWLDPAIRSVTVCRGRPADLARQYFGYGRGRAATLARHRDSLRPRQIVPAVFVAALAGLTLASIFRARARATLLGLVAAYASAIAASAVRVRQRSPRGAVRWLPIAYFVMHAAWGTGFWIGLAHEAARRTGAVDEAGGAVDEPGGAVGKTGGAP